MQTLTLCLPFLFHLVFCLAEKVSDSDALGLAVLCL